MPKNYRKPAAPRRRRKQLAEAELTPAATRLQEISRAIGDLKDAITVLERHVQDPLQVAAWYENWGAQQIALLQNRRANQTGPLYSLLAEQGVDTSEGRKRLGRGVQELQLPEELEQLPEQVKKLRTAARAVTRSFRGQEPPRVAPPAAGGEEGEDLAEDEDLAQRAAS